MRRTLLLFLVGCLVTSLMFGCSSYGTKLTYGTGELYYTKNVTEAEAKKLGDYLTKLGYFTGDEKTIQLDKSGETYQVRLPIKKGMEIKDIGEDTLASLGVFATGISKDVFNGAKVELHLCDDHLKTLKVVPMKG